MSWQIALSMSIGIVWAGVFIYLLWLHARMGRLQSELRRLTRASGIGDERQME